MGAREKAEDEDDRSRSARGWMDQKRVSPSIVVVAGQLPTLPIPASHAGHRARSRAPNLAVCGKRRKEKSRKSYHYPSLVLAGKKISLGRLPISF